MRNALTSFEAEVDKLFRFLDASNSEDDLVTAILGRPELDRADLDASLQVIQRNRTISRRQHYVSSIMVMYGALERFVEEAIGEYSETLVQMHGNFQKLPEKLRERHTTLTIEYLALLKDGKVRETEEISTIVETLHNCLTDSVPFRLNARAFSLRSSNMKFARIREIMSNLDIQISVRRVVSAPSYAAFLSESYDLLVSEMGEREINGALDHIDELVGLRNDIAHGVTNVESIDDNEIIRERADKLKAFVNALNEIFVCEVLSSRIALEQLVPIQGEVQVFDNHIACFLWPLGRLVPGDHLVMQPGDKAADLRHGPISSIEIDGNDQTYVDGRDGLSIGVCVPFKVKSNGKFYVLHEAAGEQ